MKTPKHQRSENNTTCNKVALLGDSVFDNASYVAPGKAVLDHIHLLENKEWDVELLAFDGAGIEDVPDQCRKISAETTHLVVNVGGTNTLGYAGFVKEKVSTLYEGMHHLMEMKIQFHTLYKKMLQYIVSLDKKTVVCSMYDTCPGIEPPLLAAVSIFNDVILYEAFHLGIPVIDFRQTFNEPADYSSISPLEPSERGGKNIARVLNELMSSHDFASKRSVIYY